MSNRPCPPNCTCKKHDRQGKNLGGRPRMTAQRFWARVDVGDEKDCWPWLGPVKKGSHPYGKAAMSTPEGWVGGAHRIAYYLTHGHPPPDRPYVLHKCDNPSCCNPRHLYAGTLADNQHDIDKRGRRRWRNQFSDRPNDEARRKISEQNRQRFAAMTPEERSAYARRASRGRWKKS